VADAGTRGAGAVNGSSSELRWRTNERRGGALAIRRLHPSSKCFALVQSVDPKPKRRLFDLLQSQGMQANQQVTFFSDGGETVRRLPDYLHPEAEHILDWFHLTMRITVLQQCARG
jgi:hypothetical protein